MTNISLWRQIQRSNFTDWKKVICFLGLDEEEGKQKVLPNPKFPLNLPRRLAEKIEKGNWDDPILRQFLPTREELIKNPLFVTDAIGDAASCKTPMFLHKYQGRALLLCTGACAMHCRYCFRQHFDYQVQDKEFEQELALITADPSLTEILLSGGDPLSLSDRSLKTLLDRLDAIPHVKRIRFHTRFPIGIPERIDESFLSLLTERRSQIFFTIHSNHSRELDAEIFERLKKVQKLGIPILCQTVLLKGINDDLNTLKRLFETLIDRGILPYYLHQLDRVEGTTHFEVTEEKGKALMAQLSTLLPGYGIPRYVREIAQMPSKSLITSDQGF